MRASEMVRPCSALRRKTSRYWSTLSPAVGKLAFVIWMSSSWTSSVSLSMNALALIQMTP